MMFSWCHVHRGKNKEVHFVARAVLEEGCDYICGELSV